MKKNILAASIVIFVVGCTILPISTESQVTEVPMKMPDSLGETRPVVTDSNSSTTTNSGPVIFSHEREDIVYIWDSSTNCFYYMLNGVRIDMPTGWRH